MTFRKGFPIFCDSCGAYVRMGEQNSGGMCKKCGREATRNL